MVQQTLENVGFICTPAPNRQQVLTTMIDLEKSTRVSLTQNILQKTTLKEIKERLMKEDIALGSDGHTVRDNISYNCVYVTKEGDAILGAKVLQDIPGVTSYMKAVLIPRTSIEKSKAGTKKKKKAPPVVVKPAVATPVYAGNSSKLKPASATDLLFIQLRIALRDEVKDEIGKEHQKKISEQIDSLTANYSGQIINLTNTLNLLKEEIKSIRADNYLIPKDGETITLPVTVLGDGGVVIGKDVVIKKSILVS